MEDAEGVDERGVREQTMRRHDGLAMGDARGERGCGGSGKGRVLEEGSEAVANLPFCAGDRERMGESGGELERKEAAKELPEGSGFQPVAEKVVLNGVREREKGAQRGLVLAGEAHRVRAACARPVSGTQTALAAAAGGLHRTLFLSRPCHKQPSSTRTATWR